MCLKFIYYHTFIQLIDGRINKCVTNHSCCIYRLEICVLLANISQSKSQTKCFSASIIFICLFCLLACNYPHLGNLIHITRTMLPNVWHEEMKILQGDGCWELFS